MDRRDPSSVHIRAVATRYEQKLAQEKDDKVRLRGQAGIHQKYHIDLHLGRFSCDAWGLFEVSRLVDLRRFSQVVCFFLEW